MKKKLPEIILQIKPTPKKAPIHRGNRHPVQTREMKANIWKKGQSGNPSGKASNPKTIARQAEAKKNALLSDAYRACLTDVAPENLVEAAGLAVGTTWADLIAVSLAKRAVISDTTAAKELREVTEGRLPETVTLGGSIDYTAGQSAKDRLLGKLKRNEK